MDMLLVLLEGRLVEHDNSRKEVQGKLLEVCSKMKMDADSLEERVSEEISKDFDAKEEEILGLIERLNEGTGNMGDLVRKAKEELSKEWKYEIQYSESKKGFVDSYKLKISSVKVEKGPELNTTDSIVSALQEHLNKLQDSKDFAKEKLIGICNGKMKEGEELETRINGKLEELFKAEDARIQSVVKAVKEKIGSKDPEEVEELTRKTKLTLFKNQKYALSGWYSCSSCDLKAKSEIQLKQVDFEERRPIDLVPLFTGKGELSLSFSFFSEDEKEVLKEVKTLFEVKVKVWEKGQERSSNTLTKKITFESEEPIYFRSTFTENATYCLKMRIVHQGMSTQWSDETEFTTPEFKECCVWKECPESIRKDKKYSVDAENPRIVTKNVESNYYCTIIGNTPLPSNTVTSWNIKVLRSRFNNGYGIFISVAPFDINQNEGYCNYNKGGWHFWCYSSALCSGPPHDYRNKEYGPRKEDGKYVRTGDVVGVVMDTVKGNLSYIVGGENLGVAFEGIPLDKPLVPCVLIKNLGDSVELVI